MDRNDADSEGQLAKAKMTPKGCLVGGIVVVLGDLLLFGFALAVIAGIVLLANHFFSN